MADIAESKVREKIDSLVKEKERFILEANLRVSAYEMMSFPLQELLGDRTSTVPPAQGEIPPAPVPVEIVKSPARARHKPKVVKNDSLGA